MTSIQHKKSESKKKFWGRYQNLMLVGEQGQVIPFQRFKNLAKLLTGALVVSLVGAIVLGVMLAGSRHRLNKLESALGETQQQLTKMRDEKDLLLTQIVIKKKQSSTAQPATEANSAPAAAPLKSGPLSNDKPVGRLDKPAQPKKIESRKPPVKESVKLNADARRIKTTYQVQRSLLSLSFRIYNTSKPKVPLSGRTVVVFKNLDDPPIKWLVVPRVQLVDGKPTGKKGKAFKINNYRTEKFKAYGQKPPVRFNMATIFIFSSEGELLLSKDHSFKIDVKPVPKPVIPAPKPAQDKTKPPVDPIKPDKPPVPSPTKTPETEDRGVTGADTTTGSGAPSLPATQDEGASSALPSGEVTPAPEKPVTPVIPATPMTPVTPVVPGTPPTPTETDASQTQGEQSPQSTTQGEKP